VDTALSAAVSQFAINPVIGGKTLRELLGANRDKFFTNAIPLLKHPEDEPGLKYVQVLLVSHGLLLSHLLSDESFSSEELAVITRKLSKVDPDFLIKSVQSILPDPDQTADTAPAMAMLRLRLMDVLQSVWEGPRVLPAMMRFLCDRDPRVRSKAALLVGKNHPSVRWVEDCLAAGDHRVTANAVESLWNIDSEGIRTLLWNVLTDPDNRCVGNALFGLYRLGDVDVIEQILLMAQDKRDLFRSTAAWVMGRTGDPRFHPALVNLMRDQPVVRTTAFRALGVLKQTKTRLEALPPVKVSGWRNAVVQNQDEFLVTVSQDKSVTALRPTEFILHRDTGPLLHYEVEALTRTGALSLAFLLPFCGPDDRLHASYVKAIQAASAQRRKTDGWLIAKYNTAPVRESIQPDRRGSGILKLGGAEEPPEPPAPPPVSLPVFAFLTDSAQLEAAIQASPDPLQLPLLPKCPQLIVRAANNTKAPQIVLLVPSNAEAFTAEFFEAASRIPASMKACFHAVSIGTSAAEPGILALCQQSGGMYLRCSEDEMPDLLSDLALGLIDRYRIRIAAAPGELKLQVFSERGCGSFVVQ
jgi:HEAT repeats